MTEIVKMTAFLVMVCAVSALLLSFTDSRTRPLIEKQVREAEEAARREVLPQAAEFKAADDLEQGFVTGHDSTGKIVGYVGRKAAKGFAGDVVVVAGVALDGNVAGVKVLSHTETPGLGTNATDPGKPVIKSMVGRGRGAMSLRKDGPPGEVDSITGVTVTSRAVTDAVRAILDALGDRVSKGK